MGKCLFGCRGLALSVALLALVVSNGFVQAQDTENKAVAAIHQSEQGYSIISPAFWEVVTGTLSDEEMQKLPEDIRATYDPKTTDVIFMNSKVGEGEFNDNINVVVLAERIPVSEELIAELKPILTEQYKKVFKEDFALESFEAATFGEHAAVEIKATYRLLGYDLYLHQALISGANKALVITCTLERSRREGSDNLCNASFASVKFN